MVDRSMIGLRGLDLDDTLTRLGFKVESRAFRKTELFKTELFYCRT